MPIYEYVCIECGDKQEIMQSFTDDPPICCGHAMVRKISKCAFHLKGPGWTNGYDGGVGENPHAKQRGRR